MHRSSIAVLLSTYNGEKYLKAQLASLEAQSFRAFDLLIRDDGSNDATREYIEQFQHSSSLNVTLLPSHDNVGAIKSFEMLLTYALQQEEYEYFMFCDQDDVWFSKKIEVSYDAMKRLQHHHTTEQMCLVYTDLQVVDENLHVLADSFWHYFHLDPKKHRCNNLVMQCNVTGCTMILNRALAATALPFAPECTMHDHWIALVASSFGVIDYVDEATIAYRQHHANVSGGAPKFNFKYIVNKALKYSNESEFHEVLGRQISQAEGFLRRYESSYQSSCFEVFHAMSRLRCESFKERLRSVVRFGLYKHGVIRNIGLFLWLIKISLEKKQ